MENKRKRQEDCENDERAESEALQIRKRIKFDEEGNEVNELHEEVVENAKYVGKSKQSSKSAVQQTKQQQEINKNDIQKQKQAKEKKTQKKKKHG